MVNIAHGWLFNPSCFLIQDETKRSNWGIFHTSRSNAKAGTEAFARKEKNAPVAEVGLKANASAGRREVGAGAAFAAAELNANTGATIG